MMKSETICVPPHTPPGPSAAQGNSDEEEDLNKELGVGALAEDVELDAMKDAAEAQIVAPVNVIGRYAPLVAAFCRNGCAVGSQTR